MSSLVMQFFASAHLGLLTEISKINSRICLFCHLFQAIYIYLYLFHGYAYCFCSHQGVGCFFLLFLFTLPIFSIYQSMSF